jgi:hypothetical protein
VTNLTRDDDDSVDLIIGPYEGILYRFCGWRLKEFTDTQENDQAVVNRGSVLRNWSAVTLNIDMISYRVRQVESLVHNELRDVTSFEILNATYCDESAIIVLMALKHFNLSLHSFRCITDLLTACCSAIRLCWRHFQPHVQDRAGWLIRGCQFVTIFPLYV